MRMCAHHHAASQIEIFSISYNAYTEFARDCGLVCAACPLRTFDLIWTAVNALPHDAIVRPIPPIHVPPCPVLRRDRGGGAAIDRVEEQTARARQFSGRVCAQHATQKRWLQQLSYTMHGVLQPRFVCVCLHALTTLCRCGSPTDGTTSA